MEARSRVDEFFPSKKRRHSDVFPSKKLDVQVPQGLEQQSPNKKNTLDSYLVSKSPSVARNCKKLDVACHQQAQSKENLITSESRCLEEAGKEHCQLSSFSLRCCSQECARTRFLKTEDKKDAKFHLGQDESRPPALNGESLNCLGTVLEDEGKSKEAQENTAYELDEGKHKHELAQFANDFLSICCSGIVSTNSSSQISLSNSSTYRANSTEEKRDGFPKNLGIKSANHCYDAIATRQPEVVNTSVVSSKVDAIHSHGLLVTKQLEATNTGVHSSSIDTDIKLDVKSSTPKPKDTVVKVLAISACSFESPTLNDQRGCSSLSTKKRSTKKRRTTITPQTSRKKRTPGWSAGNSLFSPGDEFWDEAIHLVDGLVSNEGDAASKFVIAGKTSADQLVMSTVNPCCDKIPLDHRADEKACEKSFANSVLAPTSTPVTDPVVLLQGGNTCERGYKVEGGSLKYLQSEISPFPIRRFDFTNDKSPEKVDSDGGVKVKDSLPSVLVETANQVALANVSELSHTEGHRSAVEQIEDSTLQKSFVMEGPNTMEKGEDKVKLDVEEARPLERFPKEVTSTSKDPQPGSKDADSMSSPSKSIPLVEMLNFSDWLPALACSVYMKKGLKKLYTWQVECLQLDGVLEGKNLVYCASTSAGKSLVAEILMLRRVISTERKALLVLPYVSICSEKAEHLELLLEPFGKKVCSFFGTRGGASLPKDASVAVCTIEKANSLINKLLEEGRLPELAVVVIDELHMVGDKDRGYLLELMLTKLRYAAGKGKDPADKASQDAEKSSGLQIIGMSATMPNAAAVAIWLQAALYETNFRPVPLNEYIKVANTIYTKDMEVVRTIRKSADLAGKDPDHVVELCHEVVQEGHSVLLFCSSRKACETSAKHVARYLPAHDIILRNTSSGPESAALALEELQKCPAGLDPVLAETLPKGVAYHHAGLTIEEREMVESCYRSGIVRVLTATSTLAAGVNLPARRVIFRQPRIGPDFIDGTRYRQMAGRAGRAGIDTRGESILICKAEELKRMSSLLNEGCQPLLSCLAEDKNGMTRAILEVVAGGIVQSASDVERYVKCTLLNSTQSFQEVVKSAQDSLRWLCHHKFLEWDSNTQLYNTSPLGKAAFGSSLSPEESLIVFEDLAKAREGFVLASDLHLVYQVTPIYVELEPDWSLYYKKFVELSSLDQAVGNRVGVMEPFLMRMAHGAPIQMIGKSPRWKRAFVSPGARKNGRISPRGVTVEHTLRVCRRFYVSLMLAKLIQETPLMEVCESFRVARGMVQALQEVSGRFASMVAAFCERLSWHDLEGLVSKFQCRVSFGVRAEIVELAEIPFVKASRARALYKAGLRTPQAVAEASISELAKALFESSSWVNQESSKGAHRHCIQLGMAKKIQNGARKLVLERAEAARVAAFSALRALGVDIPASLSQPLLNKSSLVREQIGGQEAPSDVDLVHTDSKGILVQDGLALPQNSEIRKNQQEDALMGSIRGESGQDPSYAPLTKPCGELEEDHSPIHGNDRLSQGPVDVDSMNGGFDQFFSLWQEQKEFFFDMHFTTHGVEAESPVFEVRGLAVCWVGSPIYYVGLGGPSTVAETFYTVTKERWKKVGMMLCADAVLKVTWNWRSQVMACRYPSISGRSLGQVTLRKKFELGSSSKEVLALPAINPANMLADLHLAAWLLWPDEESAQDLSLEQEVRKRLPGNIAAKASREGRWINQMGKVAHNGCCRRVSQIRALHSVIWKLLTVEGLDQPLLKQEMPLVPILAEMEAFGIRVDVEGCKHAREQLERKIKELVSTAHELAGAHFSLSVPAEVASVLYTHLRLPVPSGCNKGKQHPSTDKQALDALRGHHPIIDVIKEHRTLSKVLQSTLGSILYKARPIVAGEGFKAIVYRVKGHWLQTSTATGRLSMEEPNLQCVEHPLNFIIMQRSDEGAEGKCVLEYTINPRNFFLPFREDWLLLSADYSQIEVRLMAHFSGDVSLIELLSRPSGDLFKIITARWTGVEETNVTGKQREHTKRLVYGILYGMGINALADQLECSVPEAFEKHSRFKAAFPGVAKWLEEAVKSCREKGYICTLAGRKRYLDKIKHGSLSERTKAERQAVNSICQGSAADLIKVAMINLESSARSLRKACSDVIQDDKSPLLEGMFRLLLQIHDELVLEVHKTALREVGALLRSCMEGASTLRVPLLVKLKYGPKWGSLVPMEEI